MIDYQGLSEKNVVEIKEKTEEMDLDYDKLLEAEKKNQNRESLKEWLEMKIEEADRKERPALPEGRLPNKKEIQKGVWLYAEPQGTNLEKLDTYPTDSSEMISMTYTDGSPTDEHLEEFVEKKVRKVREVREEGMNPVLVRCFGDTIALETV